VERLPDLSERHALKAGHVASSMVLSRRRVRVSRPQLRSVEGRELGLLARTRSMAVSPSFLLIAGRCNVSTDDELACPDSLMVVYGSRDIRS
jgi:hypothetical protein